MTQQSGARISLEEVEALRRKYAAAIAAYTREKPYFHRAPGLSMRHVRNCKVFPDRYAMLDHLPKNGVCAEIGTDKAAFARRILETAVPAKLHVFELDVSRIERENIAAALEAGLCEVHEGDSAENMRAMPDGSFDWIYIDGDHRYEGVARDIEASAPKLKPDGLLVFNDYATWSPVGMYHCGVARAVNELCIKSDFELVYFAFQSMMYNDVAIRRRAAF